MRAMENPFAASHDSERTDLDLVEASLGGNWQALETLILRHPPDEASPRMGL